MELIQSLFTNVGLLEILGFAGAIIFFAARLENATKMNREAISTEIQHVLKLMEINHQNLKDDINRLEKKQEESNKIKERLATQEVLVAELQSVIHTYISEQHSHNHNN